MKQAMHLIVGLGITGRSIARYLQARNQPFIVFDTRAQPEGIDCFYQEFPGVDVFLVTLPATIYPSISTIITSPGVSLEHLLFDEARRLQIPVIGDIECLAQAIQAPLIAITGTNGKSTVTTLVGAMAKEAGLRVAVAGNIGLPVLDLLNQKEVYDLWVLELSSFQLELVYSLKPLVATVLNISPDHLDRHHQLSAYIAAKHRIYRQAQICVFNREDENTIPQQKPGLSFGLTAPHENEWGILEDQGEHYLAFGAQRFLNVKQLLLQGRHNWQNALAACALAWAAGIPKKAIQSILQSFSGLPHRCQEVRLLREVQWINDSKGTNIGATISAIEGIGANLKGKIVLIAGGLGKGADFNELRPVVGAYVRHLVLIGKDAPLIKKALHENTSISDAVSLQEAILIAQKQAQPGDVVLLSPACASQDMFRDFNDRGEQFVQLVESL